MPLHSVKDTFFSRKLSLNFKGSIYSLETPKIMGILNITPDSFYDGGRYSDINLAVERIREMIEEGADIIDIGASSSRPGASLSDANQELERLQPLAAQLMDLFPDQLFSIDTYHAEVAQKAIENYGFCMINDISGGDLDPSMIDTVARLNVPYVLMHMKGTPGNMQMNPVYENVTDEIIHYFAEKIHVLKKRGFTDVIIDPGFGFGKTLDHNYEIVANFETLSMLETPILAGVSRKSMVSRLLGLNSDQSLNGTTALHMMLLQKGVNILRVHDIAAAREAISVYNMSRKPNQAESS